MVANICNPRTEKGGSLVQVESGLYNNFQDNVCYVVKTLSQKDKQKIEIYSVS
jgi:hypothetical protein